MIYKDEKEVQNELTDFDISRRTFTKMVCYCVALALGIGFAGCSQRSLT